MAGNLVRDEGQTRADEGRRRQTRVVESSGPLSSFLVRPRLSSPDICDQPTTPRIIPSVTTRTMAMESVRLAQEEAMIPLARRGDPAAQEALSKVQKQADKVTENLNGLPSTSTKNGYANGFSKHV